MWGAHCVGAKSDGTASGVCTPFAPAATTAHAATSAPATIIAPAATTSPAATTAPTATTAPVATPAPSAAAVFSTANTVPAVESTARLGSYTTTDLFNSTEQNKVSCD